MVELLVLTLSLFLHNIMVGPAWAPALSLLRHTITVELNLHTLSLFRPYYHGGANCPHSVPTTSRARALSLLRHTIAVELIVRTLSLFRPYYHGGAYCPHSVPVTSYYHG